MHYEKFKRGTVHSIQLWLATLWVNLTKNNSAHLGMKIYQRHLFICFVEPSLNSSIHLSLICVSAEEQADSNDNLTQIHILLVTYICSCNIWEPMFISILVLFGKYNLWFKSWVENHPPKPMSFFLLPKLSFDFEFNFCKTWFVMNPQYKYHFTEDTASLTSAKFCCTLVRKILCVSGRADWRLSSFECGRYGWHERPSGCDDCLSIIKFILKSNKHVSQPKYPVFDSIIILYQMSLAYNGRGTSEHLACIIEYNM